MSLLAKRQAARARAAHGAATTSTRPSARIPAKCSSSRGSQGVLHGTRGMTSRRPVAAAIMPNIRGYALLHVSASFNSPERGVRYPGGYPWIFLVLRAFLGDSGVFFWVLRAFWGFSPRGKFGWIQSFREHLLGGFAPPNLYYGLFNLPRPPPLGTPPGNAPLS